MFAFRLVSTFALLLVVGACGSPAQSGGVPTASSSAAASTSPVSRVSPVLVGLDWHAKSPSNVILMRPDGTVIATRTLPATWLVDEHAVGAYMLVANDGSGKGWTVDGTGAVTDVAPAAAAFLSPPTNGSGWVPPLIVDSATAVTVGWPDQAQMAVYKVDLLGGAVRSLLTVPVTGSMSLGPALTVLDVSADRQTVWLRKVTPAREVEIVGIDLKTGVVTSRGQANVFAGEPDLAITRDGQSVGGQEEAGTNSSNLAVRHLHVVSLGSNVDVDLQGTAPYVGGQRSPSVLFAPGGAAVAWWGGLDNGDSTFLVNEAPLGSAGRTLYRLDTANMTHVISALYWVDASTLVVQTDSTTTPGSFQGAGLQAFTLDATTGTQKPLPAALRYVVAIIS